MSIDEGLRAGSPRHPHLQHQPPQPLVLGHHRTVTGSSRSGSWRFGSPPNGTIWSYEPEPTADGTRVVESRHAENGVKPLSDLAVSTLMGGVGGFEGESVAGMSASLARIKAAAEG
jgi:hypothetical protein